MVVIRLSRIGKTKKPTYKIVVQDKRRDPWGKVNDFIGQYDPHTKKFDIKKDRLDHWLKQGAELSATLNNLLIRQEIIKGKVKKASRNKKKSEIADKPAEIKKEGSPTNSSIPAAV
jgi:small subunit ribosomal protein S16